MKERKRKTSRVNDIMLKRVRLIIYIYQNIGQMRTEAAQSAQFHIKMCPLFFEKKRKYKTNEKRRKRKKKNKNKVAKWI